MPPTRRKKRSSSKPKPRKISPKKRSAPAKKKRAKKAAKRAPAKRAKTAAKRAPAKKRAKRKPLSRSEAAKKGWAKRKKRQRLLESMADIRMKQAEDALPIGWIEHRRQLRVVDGTAWRRIETEFDQRAYDEVRLQTLADLELDFVTKDELYDYLSWLAQELEIDISDLYQMYLGYGLSADQ